MTDIERYPQGPNTEAKTATDIILKREAHRIDKEGRIIRGDLPEKYFKNASAYFNKDSTLAQKDKEDIKTDFRHIMTHNRLIRESIPDEEYTIQNLIDEYNFEFAALNLNTMNKEGPRNNRALLTTNIVESTSRHMESTTNQVGKTLGGLFQRK
jgi:hypothetical protein